MSSNYPPPSAFGNISTAIGSFAQGYQNAKLMARDREDRDRSKLHEHANNLLQLLDSPIAKQNPSMQASLMEAYADTLDKADAGPQKKGKKQDGIGGLVKRMFGMGGYDAAPDPGPGPMRQMLNRTEEERLAKQQQFAGPPTMPRQQEPGSQTYGDMELGPATAARALPHMPREPEQPAWNRPHQSQYSSLVDANGDFNPQEALGSVATQSMAKAMPAPQMQTPAPPVVQYAQTPRTQSPQQSQASGAYQQHYLPPDQLVRQVQQQNTGKYGIQNPQQISQQVQSQANQIINDLLDHVDSFIDVTPGHETLEQAYANPQIRQALDGIQQYSHLTGQKFEDIVGGRFAKTGDGTKYSLTEMEGPDGKAVYGNYDPTQGSLTPIPGVAPYKTTPEPKPDVELEKAAIAAYQIPDAQRTPPQKQAITAYESFKRGGQAPHQPQVYHVSGINPKSGRNEIIEITEGGGQRYTGIQVADQFDPKSLMLPDRVTGYDALNNPILARAYDPSLVSTALSQGLVGPAFIQLIVDQRKKQIAAEVAREDTTLVGPGLTFEVEKRTAADPLIMALGSKANTPFTRTPR